MQIANNWYNDREVAKIFAKERGRKLIYSKSTNQPFFLEYKFNNTINYLPINPYGSVLISKNNFPIEIKELEDFTSKLNITALFLPVISLSDPNNYLPLKYKEIYTPRLDSYFINLEEDVDTLLRNICKRKRGLIKKNIISQFFSIANDIEIKDFYSLYYESMKNKNAMSFNILSKKAIESFIKLENTLVFKIKIENNIELMHLIGLNKQRNHAEFICAAATNNGYKFGYEMIWNEILFLKSLGVNHFHLGGGITSNDGVSEFKKRIGGNNLYNGGFKFIINKQDYDKEYFENKYYLKNFFPIYLRDQIFY